MKKIILIAIPVILLALILFFFPYKIETKLGLDEFKGNRLAGIINFFGHTQENIHLEINDQSAVAELLDYIGSLRGTRSFKNTGSPPPDTDHYYVFFFYDKDGNPAFMMTFNGNSIFVNDSGQSKKYRIFPKWSDIQIIDQMVADYFVEDIPDFMEPLEYVDISTSSDFNPGRDGWMQVLWIDGHTDNEQYIIFNDLKPYETLEVYESGETLIIYYDETEGNSGEVAVRVESLPFPPRGTDNKIIFILNGKRSYNTEYIYGAE